MRYGADALDPPLWPGTKHLLSGDSHRKALTCLDDFLRSHAELAVRDALKQIGSFPDTYAKAAEDGQFANAYDWRDPTRPFLRADLLRPNGPWVCISAFADPPTAIGLCHIERYSCANSSAMGSSIWP